MGWHHAECNRKEFLSAIIKRNLGGAKPLRLTRSIQMMVGIISTGTVLSNQYLPKLWVFIPMIFCHRQIALPPQLAYPLPDPSPPLTNRSPDARTARVDYWRPPKSWRIPRGFSIFMQIRISKEASAGSLSSKSDDKLHDNLSAIADERVEIRHDSYRIWPYSLI